MGATEKEKETYSRLAQEWWDFYALPASGARPRLVGGGEKVAWHEDGVTLFAVRHDREPTVLQALAAAPGRQIETLERLAQDGIVALARETLGGRGVVDDDSPVHYGITEYEVLAIRGGTIALKVRGRRELDRNRLPIDAPASGTGGTELVLLTLGFSALLVLVLLFRRRGSNFEVPVQSA